MPRRQNAKPFDVAEIFRDISERPAPAARRPRRHSGIYPAMKRAANRARNAVGTALLRKRIERPLDCTRCGRHAPGRIAANHADLTKPLEVSWICLSCVRYAWQDREDACAVAMAKNGGYVNGVWIAPAGVRAPGGSFKTLQAYSRKSGAHGGDAATRLAAEREVKRGYIPKQDPNLDDATQRFIAADLERYLSGQPSRIAEVLAGKGKAVVVVDRPAPLPVAVIPLEVPQANINAMGAYGDVVTFGEVDDVEYRLVRPAGHAGAEVPGV